MRLDPDTVQAGVEAALADESKGQYWVLEVGSLGTLCGPMCRVSHGHGTAGCRLSTSLARRLTAAWQRAC
jgi:hypothetical protein